MKTKIRFSIFLQTSLAIGTFVEMGGSRVRSRFWVGRGVRTDKVLLGKNVGIVLTSGLGSP